MKNLIKSILILGFTLGIICGASGQDTEQIVNSAKVYTAKKVFLTEKLALSSEESEKFWPVYDEYQQKFKALNESFKGPQNPMLITDEEAESFFDRMFTHEEDKIALKKGYFQQFESMLGVRKALYLHHLESQFRRELLQRIQQRMEKQKNLRRNPPGNRNKQ